MTFQPEENLRPGDQTGQSIEGNRLSEQVLQSAKDLSNFASAQAREVEARSAALVNQGVLPPFQLDGLAQNGPTGAQAGDASSAAPEQFSANIKDRSESAQKLQNSEATGKVTVNSDGSTVTTFPDGGSVIEWRNGLKLIKTPDGKQRWDIPQQKLRIRS